MLIQNATDMWSYLYRSQSLSNTANLETREHMVKAVARSTILSWKHVDMPGEYHFTRVAANEDPFDPQYFLALKLS